MSSVSDQELLDEMRRVADILGKENITNGEFQEHKEIKGSPRYRFGSWNQAKKKASLDINTTTTPEETKKDIIEAGKKVADDEYIKNTLTNVAREAEASYQTVIAHFTSKELFKHELDVQPYKNVKTDKQILEEAGRLKAKKEVVRPADFKKIASTERLESVCINLAEYETDLPYRVAEYINDNFGHGFTRQKHIVEAVEDELGFKPFHACTVEEVVEAFNEEFDSEISRVTKGGHSVMYLDSGRYDNEEKYRKQMKKKWKGYQQELGKDLSTYSYPQQALHDIYFELCSKGVSPKSAFSSIAYVVTDYSQKKVGNKVGCSQVTIREHCEEVEENLQKT